MRDSNRATAQTTQQAALAEGLSPLLRWVKGLLDEVIHRHLGYPDLEFAWADSKDQDPAQQAEIDDTYVRAGVKSVDEVRAELGLDPVGFGNAIYTGAGAVPLKDVAAGATAPATEKRDALAKYSPGQPRVPTGNPGGGQWASAGGGDVHLAQEVILPGRVPFFLEDPPKIPTAPRLQEPVPRLSGAEGAKDVPSWARGQRPYVGESGRDFAKRLLDDRYGPGNWEGTGQKTEFNRIKKWGDRNFRDPKAIPGTSDAEA